MAFGEMFHESLATIDLSTATGLNPNSHNLRHPGKDPYFVEYAPLIKSNGGVEGYSTDMAFQLYFPKGNELTDREYEYVKSLIKHSESLGKFPILTETRSLGRVPQLKKAFGGFHILLTRDPFRQWCSYTELAARGNAYFPYTNRLIMNAPEAPRWLQNIPSSSESDGFLSFDAFWRHALLHLNLYDIAASNVDLVITYDFLEDAAYRQKIQRFIKENCGFDLDLSDFSKNRQFNLVDFPSVRIIDQLFETCYAPGSGSMHPEVEILGPMMKTSIASFVSEAGELANFTREKLNELASTVIELDERSANLEAEKLSLQKAIDDRDRLGADLIAIQSDARRAAIQSKETLEQCSALKIELSESNAEIDTVRAELIATKEWLHSEVGALETQLRDALEQQNALKEALSASNAETDAVRAELMATKESLEQNLMAVRAASAENETLCANFEQANATFIETLSNLRSSIQQVIVFVGDERVRFVDALQHQPLRWRRHSWLRRQSLYRPRSSPQFASLSQLLSLADVRFVRAAYAVLLGRDADPSGETYYTNRLREGYSKCHVLGQLSRSPEGRESVSKFKKLNRDITRFNLASRPVIGWIYRFIGDAVQNHKLARLRRSSSISLLLVQQELQGIVSQTEGGEVGECVEPGSHADG